jgi:hypothetical protein
MIVNAGGSSHAGGADRLTPQAPLVNVDRHGRFYLRS